MSSQKASAGGRYYEKKLHPPGVNAKHSLDTRQRLLLRAKQTAVLVESNNASV